eukprot:1392527-Amorphochlora_amoeboformis.AAC.1
MRDKPGRVSARLPPESHPTKVYAWAAWHLVDVRVSTVASIPACHAGDRGSIPRRGVIFLPLLVLHDVTSRTRCSDTVCDVSVMSRTHGASRCNIT